MAPAAPSTAVAVPPREQAKAVEDPVPLTTARATSSGTPTSTTTTSEKSEIDIDTQPTSASSPTTSSLDISELKALRLTSTSDVSELRSEKSQQELPQIHSTYHVYHKKQNHFALSPSLDSRKERLWGPSIKEGREKRREKKRRAELGRDGKPCAQVQPQPQPQPQRKEGEDLDAKKPPSLSLSQSPTCTASDDGAFFLHTPYLAFKDPPRVLYTGSTKHAFPAVLIHGSLFWRKWKLQLGPTIAEPGVLDPRGVVAWRHNGGDGKTLKADHTLLQGYKVRTWCRLWGETGKRYVLGVRAGRKAGVGGDPDDVGGGGDGGEKDGVLGLDRRTRCEEVVYLEWTAPLSRDTRRYHFQYGGLGFQWKGTASVKENHRVGWWCRYNHLKLIARVPLLVDASKGDSSSIPTREICLGKYTSSVAINKSGKLELYDAAIWRLAVEHMPSVRDQAMVDIDVSEKGDEEPSGEVIAALKRTALYQVIISTAMCMVIGEYQKRETVRKIIEALVLEGAGGASG